MDGLDGLDGEFLLDVLPVEGGPPKRPRRGVTWESVLEPIEADVATSGPSKSVRELLMAAGCAERREPLLTTLRLQSVELDSLYRRYPADVVGAVVEACVGQPSLPFAPPVSPPPRARRQPTTPPPPRRFPSSPPTPPPPLPQC